MSSINSCVKHTEFKPHIHSQNEKLLQSLMLEIQDVPQILNLLQFFFISGLEML